MNATTKPNVNNDCQTSGHTCPNSSKNIIFHSWLNATLTKDYHLRNHLNTTPGPQSLGGIPLTLQVFQNGDAEKRAQYAQTVEAEAAVTFGVVGIICAVVEVVVMVLCDARLYKLQLAKARRNVLGN